MGVVVRTGRAATSQPHVIRKSSPAIADAIPEPIEPRPTARLDLARLDHLIDGSRTTDDGEAVEIAVDHDEHAHAVAPARPRLAHTLRRGGEEHTRPTAPPPTRLAHGSVPQLPVYVAPEPSPVAVTAKMDALPDAFVEDTSRPIDLAVGPEPAMPVPEPSSNGRLVAVIVAMMLLAGVALTVVALMR